MNNSANDRPGARKDQSSPLAVEAAFAEISSEVTAEAVARRAHVARLQRLRDDAADQAASHLAGPNAS